MFKKLLVAMILAIAVTTSVAAIIPAQMTGACGSGDPDGNPCP